MRNIFILAFSLTCLNTINAQDATKLVKEKKETSKPTATLKKPTVAHPSDHFLIQFGSDSWVSKPDSARTNGGRHFNFYLMTDKPFKTNPKYSVAYGIGIGSSNIYFDKTFVEITSKNTKLPFRNQEGSNHFAKFKLTQIFLELPVELRYTLNPENSGKSWKFAVGAKVGTLLKAYTKGKDWQDKNNISINGPSYISKEYSKNFFNTTRLSFTGRVGYGNFSLSAAYVVTPALKTGNSPDLNTLSIGLTVSGL
ncbi:MAG: outer membrane beta-barrel protein [Chitinophagaceae bacterium]